MVSIRDYSPLDRNDYFQLTQFDKPSNAPKNYQELVELEKIHGEIRVGRVSITQPMAARVLKFVEENELNTRSSVPDVTNTQHPNLSQTVFTVRFSLHIIAGKRGGWYVLEHGGREPRIKDEFIEYGPKRKSGGRKSRYRRNLSYSEQNQVSFLKEKTPSAVKMYHWILKKYPSDILNADVWFGERPWAF